MNIPAPLCGRGSTRTSVSFLAPLVHSSPRVVTAYKPQPVFNIPSDHNSDLTTASPSSQYPEDEYASVLERAINSACERYSFFVKEEMGDTDPLNNENVCFIACWDRKWKASVQRSAFSDYSKHGYEGSVRVAGIARKPTGSAGEPVSLLWHQALGQALEGDCIYQETVGKPGPDGVSLYCKGLKLPDDLMESLSKLALDDQWPIAVDAVIAPSFEREFPENATLATPTIPPSDVLRP